MRGYPLNCEMILPQSGKLSAIADGIKLTSDADQRNLLTTER
jgi:hypothetical protein